MGNNVSQSDSDDDFLSDEPSDGEEAHDPAQTRGGKKSFDLDLLFDHGKLRDAASKIKDGLPENVLQQHQGHLIRWLEDRSARNEETVSLSQFCDVLMNRGVGREESEQAFVQFDTEGDGTTEVQAMLETLKSSNGADLQGELNYVVRTLQSCILTPGFVDVFASDRHNVSQHGKRMLNFLLRNRTPSSALPFSILDGFNNTSAMRMAVLRDHLHRLKDAISESDETISMSPTQEQRVISKCYKGIDVSTNKADVHRMTDGDMSTYWQSDGTSRSHWVRIHMKPNVVLKQLAIHVQSSDQSYMPQTVTVSVGKSPTSLHEIKEVRIPSHVTGDVTLLENARMHYPVVQINIRRCHSDGCDTRIHGLKTLGYKMSEDRGVSIADASAVWYLSVLASTATASIPTNPALAQTILIHTREALRHMPPLSLLPGSKACPAFLSPGLLDEIERFLKTIVVTEEGKVQSADGLLVLMSLSLARGRLVSVLETLSLLADNQDMEMQAVPLLKAMHKVTENFWRKYGYPLQLSLTGCDGGQKDNNCPPSIVLTSDWSTETYYTAMGKKTVNFFFKTEGETAVQLTRVRIKVPKGGTGAKSGMLFLYNAAADFDIETHSRRFKEYDTMTSSQYDVMNKMRSVGVGKAEETPIAFFTLEEDWDEVDVNMDVCTRGTFILLKITGPRSDSAERVGLMGVKFYGFQRPHSANAAEDIGINQSSRITVDDTNPIDAVTVFIRMLSFLVDMTRDAPAKKDGFRSSKLQTIDMTGVSIEMLWKLYCHIPGKDKIWGERIAKVKLLQLLKCCFPFLAATAAACKEKEKKEAKQIMLRWPLLPPHMLLTEVLRRKDSSGEIAAGAMFTHLCDVVDSAEKHLKPIKVVAEQVILDGASVFFPDKNARRKQLFQMMETISSQEQPASAVLTFQSLCQFFSSVDPSGLLALPTADSKEDFKVDQALAVMDTLLSVAHRECSSTLAGERGSDGRASFLVRLLCSLQGSLATWCCKQMEGEDGKVPPAQESVGLATTLLQKYTFLLSRHCTELLGNLVEMGQKAEAALANLQHSFIATALPQMIVWLMLLCEKPIPHVSTMHTLQPVAAELHRLAKNLANTFYKLDSEQWSSIGNDQVVLRTWHVESPHNYENNQHSTQIFTCPGATHFVVEFDQRSETEKRYDYLEFTDARGVRTRYDQKVGTEKWPLKVTFRGSHRLQFLFHSDSSNNEWGYKFKVTARGSPDVPLPWLFDLQLGLSRLVGRLCGTALGKAQVVDKDSKEEENLLQRNELWGTLFRGGYLVGRLTRSLSGLHTSQPATTDVHSFLLNMAEGNVDAPAARQLLTKCQEACPNPRLGGDLLDRTIAAIFGALLWHTQELREEVEQHMGKEGTPVPDGVTQAYMAAESLRPYLLDQRQKLIVSSDSEKAEDKKDENKAPPKLFATPDNLILACKDKALFLLQFSGLARYGMSGRVESQTDLRPKMQRSLSRKLSRQVSVDRANRKQFHAVVLHPPNPAQGLGTTYGLQQDSYIGREAEDQYASFKLVLDFMRDVSITKDKVERLLQERLQKAQTVADAYKFAAEYLKTMAEPKDFQVPVVLFLQELLCSQQQFPPHYASGMEGCGLDLEAQVRTSYYTLVRRLVNVVNTFPQGNGAQHLNATYDLLQASLVHFLDIDWQPYDLGFVQEIGLPAMLLQMAKSSISLHDVSTSQQDEEKEDKQYQDCMKWFNDCKNNYTPWYTMINNASDQEEKRAMHMFVARFCDLLDVEIRCDGCEKVLPGQRYRCLQCADMDLCNTCFLDGAKPEGHEDDHDLVHLQFKCDQCQAFIVGTRIHCNTCEDFDLCLGCSRARDYPECHKENHDVTTYHLKTISSNNPSTGQHIKTYIHNHGWLLLSSLALSLSKDLHNNNLEGQYLANAQHLLKDCVELITQCLKHIVPEGKSIPTRSQSMAALSPSGGPASPGFHPVLKSISFPGFPTVGKGGMEGSKSKTSQDDSKRKEGKSDEKGATAVATKKGEDSGGAKKEDVAAAKGEEKETAKIMTTSDEKAKDSTEKKDETKVEVSSEDKKEKTEGAEKTEETSPKGKESKDGWSLDKAFAECSQERILGLLAAMLPEPGKGPDCAMDVFNISKLLPLLFDIVKGGAGYNINTQHLALGLLQKFLRRINPNASDTAIVVCFAWPSITADFLTGQTTVDFLFSLGASCLEWRGLDWVAPLATALQSLCQTKQWRPLLNTRFSKSLESLPTDLSLSHVFALFVMAGFPEVLCPGSQALLQDNGGDIKPVVVVKHFSEKGEVMVMDVRSRRRKTVKDYQLDHQVQQEPVLDGERFGKLLTILSGVSREVNESREDRNRVERVWVLALTLKAVLLCIKNDKTGRCTRDLVEAGLCPALVQLASKGTGFSRQWLLKDLEVLGVTLYRPEKPNTDEKVCKISCDSRSSVILPYILSKKEASETSSESDAAPTSKEVTPDMPVAQGLDPCEGLDEATKICFQITHEALGAPMAILRAIYELHGKQTNDLLDEVQKCFDGDAFHASEEVRKMAAKWQVPSEEPKVEHTPEDFESRATDVGVIPFIPLPMKPSAHLVAVEEPSTCGEKLIKTSEAELRDSYEKQQRSKSSALLKKEVQTHGKAASRKYLYQVNMAVATLYARHVLCSVLANWPESSTIKSETLGFPPGLETHLASLLDLLQRVVEKDDFQQVVENVVTHCGSEMLAVFAKATCQFMEETNLATETKESSHPYKSNTEITDKVHIPNAVFLSVRFDPQCHTEEDCDELAMSSSKDLKQDRHVFSGPHNKWAGFDIPGDTLHYKFEGHTSNLWGFRFTVTGGRSGRFNTGYVILNTLLSKSAVFSHLPIKLLWEWLVQVACRQTSQQRLKVVELLLRILTACSLRSYGNAPPDQDIDLSLLKPLWKLYSTMPDNTDSSATILPPLQRALTELFILAEDLAMEWGIEDNYLLQVMNEDAFRKSAAQGLRNIAAISLAIKYKNKATEALEQASLPPKAP
ncbi:zinc finger ZZ-type and EF-hand domain-containing protein 1-like [Branchiostoma floridae]|uniref:Zinc finger ZZ-type and EF-hand domain-containing protein 1-like n=1 Tax=Branchiostoma floridae TaxID=7739 RepID=A0A9J7LMK5_BRAFL|nr:zinc finger ZZ-type and EF-hand domain-containing protein 1-like [Branchiostoma floridae]